MDETRPRTGAGFWLAATSQVDTAPAYVPDHGTFSHMHRIVASC
jgi:hypothetical protein